MSELVKALVAFHKEVPSISKDSKAQYGKYADLGGVLSTVTPPLSKVGLVIMQTFEPAEGQGTNPLLITKLVHTSGEECVSRVPMIIGQGRNPLHDWGGSCTYQRRYAILSILGLCADMDTDGNLDKDVVEHQQEGKVSRPARKTESAKSADAAPAAKPKPSDPMKDDEKELLHGVIKELNPDHKKELIKRFRSEFNYPDGLVKDKIQTYGHRTFLQNAMNDIVSRA